MMEQPVSMPNPITGLETLCEDYHLEMMFHGQDFELDIEHGFDWDGMSIPRFAWATTGCPFGPKHRLAGLIHDWLYRFKILSRRQSDEVMLEILRRCGESRYNRWKMHKIVRAVGWKAWNKR